MDEWDQKKFKEEEKKNLEKKDDKMLKKDKDKDEKDAKMAKLLKEQKDKDKDKTKHDKDKMKEKEKLKEKKEKLKEKDGKQKVIKPGKEFSKHKKEKIIHDSMDKKDKNTLEEFLQKEKAQKQKLKKKQKEPAKTRAARAGLVFPVARIHSKLKNLVPANSRVGGTAAVFMAAVIEYLVAELCELAGNRAKQGNKKGGTALEGNQKEIKSRKARINPRFIQFAISEDQEFAELLTKVTLSGGGVIPLSDKKLKEQTRANKPKKQQIMTYDDDDGINLDD